MCLCVFFLHRRHQIGSPPKAEQKHLTKQHQKQRQQQPNRGQEQRSQVLSIIPTIYRYNCKATKGKRDAVQRDTITGI